MPSTVHIRKMRRADVMAVAVMNEVLCGRPEKTNKKLAAFFEAQCIGPRKSVHAWVAQQDGKLVGFGIARHWPSFGGGALVCSIDLLFVDAAARGQGIGSALMDRMMQNAKQKKCGRIDTETQRDNKAANSLYQHLGFQKRSGTPNRYQLMI